MSGARFYVATYGDAGLDVEFFSDALAYGRAVRAAQREHDAGKLDSYTNGEVNS